MSLKEKLNADFISAMKEKNEVRKNTISFVKAAIMQFEKDNQTEADDKIVTQILTKQVKMRKDALSDFEKAGRTDLYDAYNSEISVLEAYLPEQMSEKDIKSLVKDTISELGIEAKPENMGRLMGSVMPKVAGRADGNTVKKIVTETLSK